MVCHPANDRHAENIGVFVYQGDKFVTQDEWIIIVIWQSVTFTIHCIAFQTGHLLHYRHWRLPRTRRLAAGKKLQPRRDQTGLRHD